MEPEARDRFLALADELAREAGGESFEQGTDSAYRLFSRLAALFESVRTREMLVQELENSKFTKKEEWLLFAFMRFAPHIVRHGIRQLHKIAERTLPTVPSRRPAIPANDQIEMLNFINDLHFKHEIDLRICMKRAANRYGCGIRTVERCWAERKSILECGPEPRFSDVIDGWKEVCESEARQGNPLL